jgi:hypothetical protein
MMHPRATVLLLLLLYALGGLLILALVELSR